MTKKIAVLGANGRIGLTVVTAFHKAGWSVVAVTRKGQFSGIEAVENQSADAHSLVDLKEAVSGCDVVFNGLNPLYHRWHDEAIPLAKNVIAACLESGATHLFPGNLYNYGYDIPEKITPNTPKHGGTKKGHIRVQMESLFERAANSQGLQTITVRAGDFSGGAGTGSWFDLTITSQFQKGKVVYPGDRSLPHAWAYLPDLSRAFVTLAEKRTECQPFDEFLFEGFTLTGQELHTLLEEAAKQPLKKSSIPWTLFRIGALFNPVWRETLEIRYLWDTPHALDGGKLANFCPDFVSTSPDVAFKEALEDLNLLSSPNP